MTSLLVFTDFRTSQDSQEKGIDFLTQINEIAVDNSLTPTWNETAEKESFRVTLTFDDLQPVIGLGKRKKDVSFLCGSSDLLVTPGKTRCCSEAFLHAIFHRGVQHQISQKIQQ